MNHQQIGEIGQPQASKKGAWFTIKIAKPLIEGDQIIAYKKPVDGKPQETFELPPRRALVAKLGKERRGYFKARYAADGVSLEIGDPVFNEKW